MIGAAIHRHRCRSCVPHCRYYPRGISVLAIAWRQLSFRLYRGMECFDRDLPSAHKSWTLGGACADNSGQTEDDCTEGEWSHTASDWVPMFVSGDGTGDASSIAARVILKWLELGLEMDTCALSSPVCDVSGCHSTETATAVQTCNLCGEWRSTRPFNLRPIRRLQPQALGASQPAPQSAKRSRTV